MADGIDEIGTVQRIEMELPYSFIDEVHDLLRGHGRGDQMSCSRIAVETIEAARQPCRHAGSRFGRETCHLLEVVDRHDAGRNRAPDAMRARPLDEPQI